MFQVVYEHGGECLVNAHVDEILIENNRAVGVRVCKATSLEPGSDQTSNNNMLEIRAPIIVCATGIHNLYGKILPKNEKIVKEFQATNKAIPSYGHMYLFVAIKGNLVLIDGYSKAIIEQSQRIIVKQNVF